MLGDNALGSICLSVCPFVGLTKSLFGNYKSTIGKVCLFFYNQSAYADNCADAVDRLLIICVWRRGQRGDQGGVHLQDLR